MIIQAMLKILVGKIESGEKTVEEIINPEYKKIIQDMITKGEILVKEIIG